jgi:hypothetical protein cdiviTM7_01935
MIEMKRTRQDKAEKNIERIKKNPQKEKALLDNPKKSRFSLSNLSKKQKISLIIGVIFLILVIVFSFLFFFRKPESAPVKNPAPKSQKTEPKKKAKPEKFYSKLSGVEVSEKSLENAPVFGVMIENSIPARPQSGLSQAEVVFEAIAEGGITRFLALYQQNKPELLGPVRSVRSYYIDWASGFDASVAHVGGPGDALARMRDGKHKDMDEFLNTQTFWRSKNRYAPHNVYTNFTNLSTLGSSKGWNSSNFEGFSRKEDSPVKEKNATQIQVNISGFSYNSTYVYRENCNCYLRSQAGVAHTDANGIQISTKTLIVLKMENRLATDRYHNVYGNIGSGVAIVFQDGVAQEVKWVKSSESSPLILQNNDGSNFKINRGQSWIVAVGNSMGSIGWQ